MTVNGFETQVTSAIIPTFMICASIWPKPAGRNGRRLRDQYAGRTHHRIDEVADAQRELLDAPIHAGADHGLVELDLCLRERCLGAGLFRGQQC